MRIKIPPALALFLIAPVFGELFSGSSPLNEFINPVTFITLALLYGCGAIIARELRLRWQKGWLSLLLLGFAYGIYEEGVMVQSFFDPTWMDLGNLAVYGRVAGVNWVWAQHLTIFHAVISIIASIAFVEMLYPQQRSESWVKSRRWWIANWVGLLGVYLVWELLTSYNAGLWKWAAWAAVLALGALARFAPGKKAEEDVLHPQPPQSVHPFWFWWVGFLGVFGHFFIISLGADEGKYPYGAAMALQAVFDLLAAGLAWLMSRGWKGWDDRHRMALVIGGLSFFLLIGPLTVGSQYPVMYYSNPVFFLLLLWAAYKVSHPALNRQI